MDRLWDKMREAGYTDFRMGLPGNLVPVARKDYAHKNPRYGGGLREDNADGFQIYCNGGATACFAYFTIAAYDRVGPARQGVPDPLAGPAGLRRTGSLRASGANHADERLEEMGRDRRGL